MNQSSPWSQPAPRRPRRARRRDLDPQDRLAEQDPGEQQADPHQRATSQQTPAQQAPVQQPAPQGRPPAEASPQADPADAGAPVDGAAQDSHIPKGGMAKASAIMAAGTLVSRVLGFIRTSMLAVAIGMTALIGDIFEKANTVPNVIYMLLAGGMFNVVLVPQLIKAAKRPDRGADYTSRLLTLSVIVLGIFTVLLTLAAYPLMVALTRDWSQEMLLLGTAFALWTLPQVFFYGLYAVIGQILNANAKFGWYMWAPVLNNVIAIIVITTYIVLFGRYSAGDDQLHEWTSAQTVWLAAGHTVGIIAQALILLWPLSRLGIRIRPKFGWRGMGLRTTGRIAGWTLATMAISNVANLLYMRLISGATASREELGPGVDPASVPGELAANTAQLITVLPHSVFVLSISTVLFNQLARSMDLGRMGRTRELINEGLRSFAIPVMFSMVAIIVLAGPLGRMFGGEAETAHLAGAAIGQLLILLALGMPFRSANFYLMRVFYSAEDARAPMIVHTVIAGLCLAASYGSALVLPNEYLPFLVIGLFSFFHLVQYGICHVWVVRRFGSFGFGNVLSAYTRAGVCALVSGVAGAGTLWLLGGYDLGFAWNSIFTALISCVAVGCVMGVVFLVMLRALRVREFTELVDSLARRIPALKRLSR